MECSSQSIPKFVCSICGSRPIAIKIEERIEESTTYKIIEENNVQQENTYKTFFHINNNNSYRVVPFPEAGVDIIDRKLKNTQDTFEKERDDYCNTDDDDEILTYTESWEDNWLFRKKDDQSNVDNNNSTFKPVSMFVPNPTSKYQAMIGEKNVDEISDDDDDDLEFIDETTTKKKKKTTATTRRKVENGVAKYIYDQRSRGGVLLDGKSLKHHRREYNVNVELQSNSLLDNQMTILDNHTFQDDGDDEEINVSQDLNDDNLATLSDENGSVESNRSYRSELFIETGDVNQNSETTTRLSDDKLSDIDFNLFSPPKPGTIADREHKKWQTAVPMVNNPYSEENLQKRLLEKKYPPKYSSLLGITRINGLDDGKVVDVVTNDIDFETLDLPEKSNNNNTLTIVESKNEVEAEKTSSSNDVIHHDRDSCTKNTSHKSKSTNSHAIKAVTKNNATINEVDYSSADSHEEKITLPSVKKLVEVFSKKNHRQKFQKNDELTNKPKDKNINDSNDSIELNGQPKFVRTERIQPSARPLHLHSLTARSLSKEFREGLR